MTAPRFSLPLALVLAAVMAPAVAQEAAAPADPYAQAIAAYKAGDAGGAAALFHKLALAGDADAQFNLALLYWQGEGIPQNRREALYWGWRARLAGVPQAAVLTQKLSEGLADPQRSELATHLLADLQAGLDAGDGTAMLSAATVLLMVAPKPDAETAYVWQSLAAALGTPGAAEARDATLAGLAPDRQAVVQDQALTHFTTWCAARTPAPAPCSVPDQPGAAAPAATAAAAPAAAPPVTQ